MGKRTVDLLITLYGDYIRHRGGEAWVGTLIRLLGCLGASPQAVRSSTSRLARHGWLARRREGRHSFYAITPKMTALLAEGGQRIYDPPGGGWDNCWYIVDYVVGEAQREQRNRLRRKLLWLGFGQLSSGTWIAPRDLRPEVTRLIQELGLDAHVAHFRAELLDYPDPAGLASRCWDLKGLNSAYRRFLNKYGPQYESARHADGKSGLSPRECFIKRFWLVHEFRRFPYRDPYLPPHMLPRDWLGQEAVELFNAYQSLLAERANHYVDQAMAEAPTEAQTGARS